MICLGNDWRWNDRSTVDYLNWAPGEPSDKDGVELCVEMYTDDEKLGMWNDHICNELRGYACKVKKGKLYALFMYL